MITELPARRRIYPILYVNLSGTQWELESSPRISTVAHSYPGTAHPLHGERNDSNIIAARQSSPTAFDGRQGDTLARVITRRSW